VDRHPPRQPHHHHRQLGVKRRRDIAAPGVGFVAMNANGTVAWTSPSAVPGTRQVFVHDATGTRLVGTDDAIMAFGFDGTILRHGPKTLQLPR
jgi:hypothetical protein